MGHGPLEGGLRENASSLDFWGIGGEHWLYVPDTDTTFLRTFANALHINYTDQARVTFAPPVSEDTITLGEHTGTSLDATTATGIY